MNRIGRALLIGMVVGLVVGGIAVFVLPAFGLARFAFPAIIGTASGIASALVAPRSRKIAIPIAR